MVKCTVSVRGQMQETGKLSVQIDDAAVFSYDYYLALNTDDAARNHFTIEIPKGAKRMRYTRDGVMNGEGVNAGTLDVALYDLAGATAPLWNTRKSMCRRILEVNYQLKKPMRAVEGYAEDAIYISRHRRLREDRWLQPMYDTAAAHGVNVPAALASFAKINMEANMGGGVFVSAAGKAVDMMPEVQDAKTAGGWGKMPQDQFDVVMALYDRCVTVCGDGNHFNGVIWDPKGISAQDAKPFGDKSSPMCGPDGVFWVVAEEAGGWRFLKALRAPDGTIADADEAVRQCFMTYFLRDIGQGLIDAEVVPENAVFYDSNVVASQIDLSDPNGWSPISIYTYDLTTS